jgi:type I restriction enzyme S subunit
MAESADPERVIKYVEISGVTAGQGITEVTDVAFGEAPSRARRKVRDGDVLVSTVRTYLRAIAPIKSPPENMIASTGFAVLRARDIKSEYLGYAMQAEYFISEVIARSVGVSYPAINATDLMKISIPVPSPAEQAAIAAFLDRETGKIDTLVEEQRRLIELLKEKRHAVVSHTVTKGLDPHAKMKPSGIEWLGEVPNHWQVIPLRALFHFVKRQNEDQLEVLSVYRDHGVIYKASRDDNINKTPEDLSKYQTVNPGDFGS